MKLWTIWLTISTLAWAGGIDPQKPMLIKYENTTNYRWLNKPVLESRLLDNMEDLAAWSVENSGEGRGEMRLTTERAVDGTHSLRLRARTMGEKPGSTMGRPPGSASIVRRINGEDWGNWNRLSFWVYPDLPGFRVVTLLVLLNNSGATQTAGWRDHGDFVLLKNHQWNHVVSEFAHVARDKIVGVEIEYRLQGNEPGATDVVSFDFDHLELQRVESDYFEGWKVWPGRISFSHTGYPTGAPKTAIASGVQASEFQIIRQDTGQAVLTKPLHSLKNHIGEFQVMDFSEVRQPGAYAIKIGDKLTQPFSIGDDVWRGTIWKAINFFYSERCGYAVPGVHDVCHRDWQGVHGDKRIIINGGWHDAGDLSQGLVNTSQAVYYMFALAEKLRAHNDLELSARLIEEAKWGLDWVLKTTFHDGYRVTWATMDFWTNGVLNDADDVTAEARKGSYENLLAAAAEGIAYRVLRDSDPHVAARSLKTAREDWQYGIEGMASPQRGFAPVEAASVAILASLELYRATGEKQYSAKAVEMASVVTGSQQRTFLSGLDLPVTGFFYTDPSKTRLLHYYHVGQQQLPMMAMRALCNTFPDHQDWIKWYSTAALHAEYLKATAQYTEPYGMLPGSLYRDDEYLQMPEERREFFRTQVLKGTKVGEHYYLRLFPVWMTDDFRGNDGVILSAAKAASEAASLRGDLQTAELAQRQLEWAVGRNPFSQSLMYGEGYDYAPQYTAMSGNIVGSLPVGIQTRFDHDVPYSPAANWPTWREVWVLPVSRWFSLMQDLAGPALLDGVVARRPGESVRFRELSTGDTVTAQPDFALGEFKVELAQGNYEVSTGSVKIKLTVLPGSSNEVDLRPETFLAYEVSSETDRQGNVTITVTARGEGSHSFALLADNLSVAQPRRTANLNAGAATKITWQGKLDSTNSPWVAVIVPDGRIDQKQEAFGATRK